MDIQFGNLAQLNWLWLLAAVVLVVILASAHRRRMLSQFATSNLIEQLFPKRAARRQKVRTIVTLTAMALIVIGLVDVRWGKTWREVPQRGIEVMFVLDVSRSMLAQDASPSRLQRAKQQIKDMVDEMAGDRVGLVVFSGEAKQQVPLTRHYHDFKRTLDEVGPHDVQLGGSRLGDAISLSADSFLTKTSNHKAIVVFTDGEDHESNPVEIAKNAFQDQGVRIFTVGLGDMQQGSRIPADQRDGGRGYLEHAGQQVWSKLNGDVLKQVALATNGAFVPAGTSQVDMADVYRRYVANVEQQDFETARINAYVPRFQYFVGAALALLLLELFWRNRDVTRIAKPAGEAQEHANAETVLDSVQSGRKAA